MVDDAPRVEIPREGAIGVWGLYEQVSHSRIPQKLQPLVRSHLSVLLHNCLDNWVRTIKDVVQTCMVPAVRAAAGGTLRRRLLQGNY